MSAFEKPLAPASPPQGADGASPHDFEIDTAPAAGSGQGWWTRGAALMIVVALAATSMVLLRGNADVGGAASPESAAESLLAALAAEDLIGAAEALAPEERDALARPIFRVVDELRRLGILADGLDMSSVDGFDVEFQNLSFGSSPLGEGVAVVSVSGGYTVATDGSAVPIGDLFGDALADDGLNGTVADEEPTTEEGDLDFELVAVQRDGEWFVSLFYSVAELARAETALPVPEFGNGIVPVGSDSPEAAVEDLLRRSLDLDAEGVIAQLPPTEMAVLYDYGPLFTADAERRAAEFRADSGYEASLENFVASSDVDGDRATVRIESLAAEVRFGDEGVTVDTSADCMLEVAGDSDCAAEAVGGIDDLLGEDFTSGIRTVRVDGRWYVSPLDTAFTLVLSALESIDRADIEEMFEGFGLFGMLLIGAAFMSSFDQGFDQGFDLGSMESDWESLESDFDSGATDWDETDWGTQAEAESDSNFAGTAAVPGLNFVVVRPVPAGTSLREAIDDGLIVTQESSPGYAAAENRYWTDEVRGDEVLAADVNAGDWLTHSDITYGWLSDEASADPAWQPGAKPASAEPATTTTPFVLGPIGG